MTQKQHDKHIADNVAEHKKLLEGTELPESGPSPDGLGKWQGGRAALMSNRWVGEKSHPQRTGDAKNKSGIDYASKITHRQDADFTEIRMVEEKVLLYNSKTDAWDIEGTTDDMPFHRDEEGNLWSYNFKSGNWDVEVTENEV